MGFALSRRTQSSSIGYPNRYVPGGYHPVKLGDRLNAGQYRVVHKLGRGSYSTVWLAHDASKERFVAIKIVVACSVDDTHERDIRQHLVKAAATSVHPGRNYVQKLLDVFLEVGPHGRHQCLVSTPAATSVADCMEASQSIFPLEVSRAIAAQIILGTGFLHSQGIVHGDLHLGNCLLAFPTVHASKAAQLGKGKSSAFVLTRREDGTVPAPRVPPSSLTWDSFNLKPCYELTIADARVMLSDFGGSWQPDIEDRYRLHTAAPIRPPESMFAEREDRPLGLGGDVWALACAVFAVYTDHDLFVLTTSLADETFLENIFMLGRPPQPWWEMWDARDRLITEEDECVPLHDHVVGIREDRERYADEIGDAGPAFGDDEAADLENMLAAMLRWDPDERIAVSDLVDGAWMCKWGRPPLSRVDVEADETPSS